MSSLYRSSSSTIVSIPGGYHIRMFISWLKLSVRATVFRSYSSLLAFLLRLIRHCQVFLSRKERAFREPGLAFCSHPADQEKNVHVTLAVPLLKAPLQSLEPNFLASNNQSFPTPSVPSTPSYIPMPKLSIHTTVAATTLMPHPAASGQLFDITLTPIIPEQIKRYERNQLYA
jgi:hypothetical protein